MPVVAERGLPPPNVGSVYSSMLPDGRELFMFDAHRGLPCSVDGKRLEIVTRVIGWLSRTGTSVRLRQRNTELPEGAQATTEAEFDEITKYFVPPLPTEGFDVTEYDADRLADSAEPPNPRMEPTRPER